MRQSESCQPIATASKAAVRAYGEALRPDLRPLGIPDNSVDVVISNCVINLSPDKRSVFSEIFVAGSSAVR